MTTGGRRDDLKRPNPARIYDYALGGDANFTADRATFDALNAVYLDSALVARPFLVSPPHGTSAAPAIGLACCRFRATAWHVRPLPLNGSTPRGLPSIAPRREQPQRGIDVMGCRRRGSGAPMLTPYTVRSSPRSPRTRGTGDPCPRADPSRRIRHAARRARRAAGDLPRPGRARRRSRPRRGRHGHARAHQRRRRPAHHPRRLAPRLGGDPPDMHARHPRRARGKAGTTPPAPLRECRPGPSHSIRPTAPPSRGSPSSSCRPRATAIHGWPSRRY